MQLSYTEWPIPALISYVTTLFHVPHRNANFQRSWRLPISPKNTSSDSKVHMFYYYLTLTWNISHTNYHLITNTVSCYYFVSLLPVSLQFSCCKLQGKIMLSFCFQLTVHDTGSNRQALKLMSFSNNSTQYIEFILTFARHDYASNLQLLI